MSFDLSLRPIDVGFNLKLHGMMVQFDSWDNNQELNVGYEDENGEAEFKGTKEEVAKVLALAGYEIMYETTPNGREIRCRANSGLFEAQPINDNYWLEANSFEEILEKTGWDEFCQNGKFYLDEEYNEENLQLSKKQEKQWLEDHPSSEDRDKQGHLHCKECGDGVCICQGKNNKWAAHCMLCKNCIGERGTMHYCAETFLEAAERWEQLNKKESDYE